MEVLEAQWTPGRAAAQPAQEARTLRFQLDFAHAGMWLMMGGWVVLAGLVASGLSDFCRALAFAFPHSP